ncbi:hypothetical protein EON66_00780 [archaeon]|nr:MAG: hypothetical protein EON66_00780 [archaeon]
MRAARFLCYDNAGEALEHVVIIAIKSGAYVEFERAVALVKPFYHASQATYVWFARVCVPTHTRKPVTAGATRQAALTRAPVNVEMVPLAHKRFAPRCAEKRQLLLRHDDSCWACT